MISFKTCELGKIAVPLETTKPAEAILIAISSAKLIGTVTNGPPLPGDSIFTIFAFIALSIVLPVKSIYFASDVPTGTLG